MNPKIRLEMEASVYESAVFGEAKLVHEDNRRAISECNGADFSVQMFDVKASDVPLGLHAHGKKFEVFTILEGGGEVLTCPVSPIGEKLGEPTRTELGRRSVVRIPPLTAHTFYLAPGTRMHCFSSSPFDPNTPDMIPCKFLALTETGSST